MRIIELEDVSFAYPNGYLAVENISMQLEAGDSIAIIGQNGAGKTTTVKLMNNLYQPTSGRVLVLGEDTRKHTTAQISRNVGYVFQNPDDQIFNSDVRKEIAYGPRVNKIPQAEARRCFDLAVQLTGLEHVLDENPYNLPLSIRKFVTIASVIAMNPDVLIFDEPTAGQDMIGLRTLENLIHVLRGLGKTVITITHDMEFVIRSFQHVIVMAHKRKIADGDVADIFWDTATLNDADLKQPFISSLARRLGFDERVMTCDDLVSAIKNLNA
jgi:energy-coupling factor transport system ATP-binding protein